MNKKIVIKIGSSLVASESNVVEVNFIRKISSEIKELINLGYEVILVSSGAIACGMKLWNLDQRPQQIEKLQALSAVGQIDLINSYQNELKSHGLFAAQVLLSHEDFKDSKRSNNIKKSIINILALGAIPIINENDSVSTEEIEFGDNDQLSGDVAKLIESQLLIILTDQDGVFDKDPNTSDDAKLINKISFNDLEKLNVELGESGKFGRGGMKTKFYAAKNFLKSTNQMWIANGREEQILLKIVEKKESGTEINLN